MKRFLSLFLILAIFCSLVIPVSAANPTVSVSPSKTAVCTACGDKKEQTIPVIGSTETTTEKESESSTEESTEASTEPTTFEEESTEEPSTQASSDNVKEKPSTAKTVVLTVLATLGIEAIIAGLIILILKQRKKKKEQ